MTDANTAALADHQRKQDEADAREVQAQRNVHDRFYGDPAYMVETLKDWGPDELIGLIEEWPNLFAKAVDDQSTAHDLIRALINRTYQAHREYAVEREIARLEN